MSIGFSNSMLDVEPVVTACPRCGGDITTYWMKDNTGLVSKPEYTLVADWVFHSECFDVMVNGALSKR